MAEIGAIGGGLTAARTAALTGLDRAGQRAAGAGQAIAAGRVDTANTVALVSAETEFSANAKVLAASDRMTREAIDLIV